jgi:hypothetical protein
LQSTVYAYTLPDIEVLTVLSLISGQSSGSVATVGGAAEDNRVDVAIGAETIRLGPVGDNKDAEGIEVLPLLPEEDFATFSAGVVLVD